MKQMKQITILLILLLSVCIVNATQVNIYYPHNNTTTDIYYATSSGYNYTESNNVSGDFSVVILKDQIIADDIIDHPKTIYNNLLLLVYVLLFGMIIIAIARVVS